MLNDIPGLVRIGHPAYFMFVTNMMIMRGSLLLNNPRLKYGFKPVLIAFHLQT